MNEKFKLVKRCGERELRVGEKEKNKGYIYIYDSI